MGRIAEEAAVAFRRATRIAARIGQTLAILFALAGAFIFKYPIWVLLGAFVYFGARREAGMVQMRAALSGLRVADLMLTDFRVLDAGDTLSQAREQFLASWQRQFPVISEGRVVGILTIARLDAAIGRQGNNGLVSNAMETEPKTQTNLLCHSAGCSQQADSICVVCVRSFCADHLLRASFVGPWLSTPAVFAHCQMCLEPLVQQQHAQDRKLSHWRKLD